MILDPHQGVRVDKRYGVAIDVKYGILHGFLLQPCVMAEEEGLVVAIVGAIIVVINQAAIHHPILELQVIVCLMNQLSIVLLFSVKE